MTDPIADMLTRIRNASAVKKTELVLPMSKIKKEIAEILEKNGWVEKVEIVQGEKGEAKKRSSQFNQLKIKLKYDQANNPLIRSISRTSKPGLRIYAKKGELPKVLNGLGMAIISTSSGLMTNREAEKKGVGGEIICEVY